MTSGLSPRVIVPYDLTTVMRTVLGHTHINKREKNTVLPQLSGQLGTKEKLKCLDKSSVRSSTVK